ncbi:hypothetical protein GC169_09410 [bacterium]|nr:hypothetical protein [bacterium]
MNMRLRPMGGAVPAALLVALLTASCGPSPEGDQTAEVETFAQTADASGAPDGDPIGDMADAGADPERAAEAEAAQAGEDAKPAERPDPLLEAKPPPPDPEVEDACGAEPLGAIVGQPLADADAPREGPLVRYIGPTTIVTRDHRPERLNIHTDDAGVVTKVVCG